MGHPASWRVVGDFERGVAEYTGAPYVVAVNSCTNALFLCLEWMKHQYKNCYYHGCLFGDIPVLIPKHTYVGVAMSIVNTGYKVEFEDLEWRGMYQLKPYPIWDAARRFTSGMYRGYGGGMLCTSHHWAKILGIQQGGCILLDNLQALDWFRRARFDGRIEGLPAKHDKPPHRGWHMYMSPEIAAEGLVRLAFLPDHNEDLPNDDYPDLSQMEVFK